MEKDEFERRTRKEKQKKKKKRKRRTAVDTLAGACHFAVDQ